MPRKLNTTPGAFTAFWRGPWVRIGTVSRALITILGVSASAASASPDAADHARLCDLAAREASEARQVPLDVLRAISRAETGRAIGAELHPWPWTVNMEGKGKWFSSQDDARAYVFKHFKKGARSFDVGCFQINYKWHGTAFRSIDDMFDPRLNADYAASFLRDLYQEFGDWTAAAGAYHSRTDKHADRYSARFEDIRNTLTAHDDRAGPKVSRVAAGLPRQNRNPFSLASRAPLIGEGTGRLGSLVPAQAPGRTSGLAFVAMN